MLLSKTFLIFGIICLTIGAALVFQRNNPWRLAFSLTSTPISKTASSNNPPVEFIFPHSRMDLPIVPSKITRTSWETTPIGVSWLASSPVPGEIGNSVLYGHNWNNIFGNLVDTKPGEEFMIRYKDKTVKSFVVLATATVTPGDIKILDPSSDKRVTVYTCTGWFDQKRFVVVGVLKGVDSQKV